MEKEIDKQEDNSIVYVIGAVIVIAVIVAGILLWPKQIKKETAVPAATEEAVQSKTMLTKLVCEKQWYNPVVGMQKFYLSADGGDISTTTKVDCTFTLTNAANEVVKTDKVAGIVTSAPDRGGNTFVCTTKALEGIPTNVALKMTTLVTNDSNQTASCTGQVMMKTQ